MKDHFFLFSPKQTKENLIYFDQDAVEEKEEN